MSSSSRRHHHNITNHYINYTRRRRISRLLFVRVSSAIEFCGVCVKKSTYAYNNACRRIYEFNQCRLAYCLREINIRITIYDNGRARATGPVVAAAAVMRRKNVSGSHNGNIEGNQPACTHTRTRTCTRRADVLKTQKRKKTYMVQYYYYQ